MVNAFFSQAYLALVERIKAVPGIAWVDQDLDQLENYETRPPVQFPCVLLDFLDTAYDENGQQVQTGHQIIQLRLGFAPYGSANSAVPTIYQEKALEYFELEHALFVALHGWPISYNDAVLTQPLVRKRATTEQRNDPYRVRVIQFTTDFEDDSAKPTMQRVTAKMNIARG